MIFDVFFFGCPLVLCVCMVMLGLRERQAQFWRPAICLGAYCIFYLSGGREVILYLMTSLILGGAWCAR